MRDGDTDRLAALERRVRLLEDRAAIADLVARYGPAADSGAGEALAGLWTGDGSYDFGGGEPLRGAGGLRALVDLDSHRAYMDRGCGHVLAPPAIEIRGDRAAATGHSCVFVRDGAGWRAERVSANRWELLRTGDGWKVARRINRLLDGSAEARGLLGRAADTAGEEHGHD